MADFKKLSAVEVVETVSDTASVLIEENGIIKRTPKDKIGMNLKHLDTVESISDASNILIEENGVIKKAPKTAVGSTNKNTSPVDIVFYLSNGTVELVQGTYEEVRNKIESNEPVLACLTEFMTGGSPFMLFQYHANMIMTPEYSGGDIIFLFTIAHSTGSHVKEVSLYSDHTLAIRDNTYTYA